MAFALEADAHEALRKRGVALDPFLAAHIA
jgi:hypothetical protein